MLKFRFLKILIMAMTKIWLNTIIIYVLKYLFQLKQPGYVVKLFDKYIYLVCRLATQRQSARKKWQYTSPSDGFFFQEDIDNGVLNKGHYRFNGLS